MHIHVVWVWDCGGGVCIWPVKREKQSDSSTVVSVTVSILHNSPPWSPRLSLLTFQMLSQWRGERLAGAWGSSKEPRGSDFCEDKHSQSLGGTSRVVRGWGGGGGSNMANVCPAQEIDGTTEQQSHLINFIYGQWQAATPAWGGHNQLSGYYALLTANP